MRFSASSLLVELFFVLILPVFSFFPFSPRVISGLTVLLFLLFCSQSEGPPHRETLPFRLVYGFPFFSQGSPPIAVPLQELPQPMGFSSFDFHFDVQSRTVVAWTSTAHKFRLFP